MTNQLLRKKIDNFVPSKSAEDERMRWQAEYVARILRIIHQEVEALEKQRSQSRHRRSG